VVFFYFFCHVLRHLIGLDFLSFFSFKFVFQENIDHSLYLLLSLVNQLFNIDYKNLKRRVRPS
jgi:hypothetical protein